MSVLLTITEAVRLVRKNLDELEPNGSVMYGGEDSDNASLDKLIERSLPEAINAVNLAAPVTLLEVINELPQTPFSVTPTISDGVITFTPAISNYLRLVEMRVADSPIVVTAVLDEASAEGRKQLNRYLRGRPDRPRLVRLQGNNGSPSFKYYTTTISPFVQTGNNATIKSFAYVSEVKYNETTPADSYTISQRLRQNILDYTTGMVLQAMGDQRAQSYYQKASIFA